MAEVGTGERMAGAVVGTLLATGLVGETGLAEQATPAQATSTAITTLANNLEHQTPIYRWYHYADRFFKYIAHDFIRNPYLVVFAGIGTIDVIRAFVTHGLASTNPHRIYFTGVGVIIALEGVAVGFNYVIKALCGVF